jgi:hypothetical protein
MSKSPLLSLVIGLALLGRTSSAGAPDQDANPSGKPGADVAQVEKLLDELRINTTGFQDGRSLAKFLAALQRQVPAPVDYHPPGKENEDRIWVLLARPFIWIEGEVDYLRKEGKDLSPKAVWESFVLEEEKPRRVRRLPLNDQTRDVLQAVVTDVLTNPALKDTREFYGTAQDRTFTLVDQEELGWPEGFRPETPGFRQVQWPPDPFVVRRRVLGIRLDKFDLGQQQEGLFNTPIEVCLCNAGGDANGPVIGCCSVYYSLKRVGERWTVQCCQILDP